MYFLGCSNSEYPMDSGEQYRTIWSSCFILPLFYEYTFVYLKHIFCFSKLKILGVELAIEETLYKEYYMHVY